MRRPARRRHTLASVASQLPEERPLRTAFIAFAIAVGLVAVLGLLAGGVPLVNEHLGVLVALVFLFVPVEMAWRRGRDMDIVAGAGEKNGDVKIAIKDKSVEDG